MNTNQKESTMSEPIYNLTLTATQLEELRAHFPSLAATAKKKPTPRVKASAAETEPFTPNTGNAEVDAFMRRSHRADWQDRMRKAFTKSRPGMVAIATPAPGHGSKALTQKERAVLYRNYRVVQHSA